MVKKGRKVGGATQNLELIEVSETINDPVPQVEHGGPVSGQVTVVTRVLVLPPFILSVMAGKGGMAFEAKQTFPYTYEVKGTL